MKLASALTNTVGRCQKAMVAVVVKSIACRRCLVRAAASSSIRFEGHPGEMVSAAASGRLRAGRLSPYRSAAICRTNASRIVSPIVSPARPSDRYHDIIDPIIN